MSTNPKYSQYGGASSPNMGTGLYTGKITLIYDDGRVRVFVNNFGRNIGPCRIVNKSAGDAISLNDEVLCTYANDVPDELIVVGRLTERVDPISESTSGLIVEASTTSELVRITQKGTGAALLVEDSTNPDSTPFIIDTSGNVGIGVSSPTAKIDVSGAAVISGDLTVDTSTLKVDSSNNRVGIGTASPSVTLDISGATSISGDLTVDTTTLKVDSTNNRVGIGTASPSSPLHIADTSGYGVRIATTTNLGLIGSAGESDALRISGGIPDQVNVGGNIYVYGNTHATRAADVAIQSNGNEIITVDGATLRVGIGTTSPDEALDVRGNIALTGSVIFEGATADTFETTITVVDPTADRTITLPNVTGTVVTTGNLTDITSVGTLTNLTVTNAINGTLAKTVTGTNTADLLYGAMADNDFFRIRIGGTASNAGYVEIATADDGTEPIYARQYTGVFTTLTRTATILDGSGNTSFPGTVTAGSNIGWSASTYLAPVSGATTQYGSVKVFGTPTSSGWEGYSIAGTAVFMAQSTYYGLYDNTNLEWGILCTRNGQTDIYYNGSSKISTTNTGASVTGTLSATTLSGSVSASYLVVTGDEWLRTTNAGGWVNTTYNRGINCVADDGYVKTYPSNGASTNFSANYVYVNGRLYGPGTNSHPTIQMREGNGASWSWTGTYTMYVDVTAVKTFVIDHPIKQDNYLVHACAEGPTSDVFYRGTGQLQNGVAVIELPDYFESLTEEEGRTVMITPIADETGNVANLAAHEIYEGKFVVELAGGYVIKNQRFWWRVDAVRKNTSFAVEPEKSSVTVSGDGPYTYIQRT